MKILFIHQNFPGQYKHLAPLLAKRGHECMALTLRVSKPTTWMGVKLLPYSLPKRTGQNLHPWLIDLDSKVTRADACFRAARALREKGYTPDLILAHPGWGEALFLKDVWPDARMGLYCELYHLADQHHLRFDPEFAPSDPEMSALRIRMKNIYNHLQFPVADAGISPTRFQADTFPKDFQSKITLCHDGIDTNVARPDSKVTFNAAGERFSRADEVITFINRNLEPYRGYHVFMRALPRLLRERPRASVFILGGDEVSYGAAPPKGQTWKKIFIDEVRDLIPDRDWARVHFLGRVPYDRFLNLLQLSRVHVYLTYPFVLSWSLMEAMSCEAAIVASDTSPVREVITDGQTGRLVDFFDGEALVAQIISLLDDEAERQSLGTAARRLMIDHYDLETRCLPDQLAWISALTGNARV